MKQALHLTIIISLILTSCTKQSLTSEVGRYSMSFEHRSIFTGWEMVLKGGGEGSLSYKESLNEMPGSVFFQHSCGTFSYTIIDDIISFSNCTCSFTYKDIQYEVVLSQGVIEWGYTQGGSLKKGNHISIDIEAFIQSGIFYGTKSEMIRFCDAYQK